MATAKPNEASAAADQELLAAPYELLLERVEETIKLRRLLSELLFIFLYFIFFIVFVVLQSQTEPVYEMNLALNAQFRQKPFPGSDGHTIAFDNIVSGEDWRSWFDNVALPTIIGTRYQNAFGASRSPTPSPSNNPTKSPGPNPSSPTTTSPTNQVTAAPTSSPSSSPITSADIDSASPTTEETDSPTTAIPSNQPTVSPSSNAPSGRRLAEMSPNDTQLYFSMIWQKRVKSLSGSNCVQGPGFMWNSLAALQAPLSQPLPASNAPVSPVCYPPSSISNEATQWDGGPAMFTYFASSPISLPGYLGVLQTFYPSSGFYSFKLDQQFASQWPAEELHFMDSASRLVAVSAVSFNPTYKMWSLATAYAELLEDGAILPGFDAVSGPLMYCSSSVDGACVDSPAELVIASIVGVFIILHFIFLVLVRRAYELYLIVFKSGRKSVGQVAVTWFVSLLDIRVALDLSQAALGLITLSYISGTYWSKSRYNTLTKIPLNSMTSNNVATVVSALNEYSYMQQIFGCQIILFNIQVFKYFPALPCFGLVRNGWYNVYVDVVKVFIMYWVLIFAYSLIGMVVFGPSYIGFATYATSLSGTIRMILGEAGFDALKLISPDFAWIFLLFFIISFIYILQALFLAVVIEGFRLAFQTQEAQKGSTNWKNLITKTLRNDARNNSEWATRLRAWKNLKVNKYADFLTKAQLKSALKGQTHNRLEITDEVVDEIFLLVRAHELKPVNNSGSVEETPATKEFINSVYSNENSALMPQLIRTLFEIKSNERSLMKDIGSILAKIRTSRDDARRTLEKAERASTIFVKEE